MINKPKIFEHISKQVDFTILDVQWIPDSSNLCVLGSTTIPNAEPKGILNIFEMDEGKLILKDTIKRKNPLKCAASKISQKNHLVLGDAKGRLQILDMNAPSLPVVNIMAHSTIINQLDVNEIGSPVIEIATASKDGLVKIWDCRQEGAPTMKIHPEPTCTKRECWSVAYGGLQNNSDRYLAAGYENGDVKLFDLRHNGVLKDFNFKNGVCDVNFTTKCGVLDKLVATTIDDGVYIIKFGPDGPQSKVLCSNGESTRAPTIWSAGHIPQSTDHFATLHGDGSMKLWKHGNLHVLDDLRLTDKPVYCMDWNDGFCGLGAVGSLDGIVRVMLLCNF